jgi:hypothetical protein
MDKTRRLESKWNFIWGHCLIDEELALYSIIQLENQE